MMGICGEKVPPPVASTCTRSACVTAAREPTHVISTCSVAAANRKVRRPVLIRNTKGEGVPVTFPGPISTTAAARSTAPLCVCMLPRAASSRSASLLDEKYSRCVVVSTQYRARQ